MLPIVFEDFPPMTSKNRAGYVKEQNALSPRRCSLRVRAVSRLVSRTCLVTCGVPVPVPMRVVGPAVQLVAPPCTDAVHGVDVVRVHRAPCSISIDEPLLSICHLLLH